MALLGFSGFETGDTSEWIVTTAGITVQSTTVNPNGGAYAATSTTIPSVLSRSITAQSTLYVRFYLRLHALSTSIPGVAVFVCSSSGGAVSGIGINSDSSGNPSIFLLDLVAGGPVSSPSAISLDTWHRVEFKTVISASAGILELYVDGTLIQTVSSLNTGSSNLTGVALHYENVSGGSPSGTIYWDDVSYGTTAYPGAGVCLARQFNQTAPHYNAWTKSIGSVWNCWDDTPFSATTNCSTGTSGGEQTGVPNFSNTTDTGASGHGPGFLLSYDTVNIAKISWVGKTSSTASDGADSSVFRTPAGSGGSDTTTAGSVYTTSDAYQETTLTSVTTAQALSCEVGISKGTGTKTHTVEDVWLMVDATLGPRPKAIGHHYKLTPAVRVPIRRFRVARHPCVMLTGVACEHYQRLPIAAKPKPRKHFRRISLSSVSTSIVGHAVRAGRRLKRPSLSQAIAPRKERWLRYPVGMPFVRLAHAARRFTPRPKIPFKVRKALWLRYSIGLPFVRLAHASRHFIPKPKIPFKVRKERWLRYPIGLPFVRLAHTARRFIPKPKVPFRVHKERWLRYPIGMPFVRIARVGRHFVPRPKLPFKVRKERLILYPIAPYFVNQGEATGGSFGAPSIDVSTWGLQTNDLLVAFLSCNSNTDPGYAGIVGGASFTEVGFTYNEVSDCISLSYLFWPSSPGGTTIAWSSQSYALGILYAFRGLTTIDQYIMPLGHGGTSGGNSPNLSVPGPTKSASEPLICIWTANTLVDNPGDLRAWFTATDAAGNQIGNGYRMIASAGATPPTENSAAQFYWVGVGVTFQAAVVLGKPWRNSYRLPVPRPKIPFRVHKERGVRYPIGLPFVRLAHAARQFVRKPKVPFKVRKERWQRYPVGMPFVRLAHAVRRFVPKPRTPFRVRKERWLSVGLPFIRLAHTVHRFVPRPKVPFKVRKALWLRYPIGLFFVRLAHAARHFVPKPRPSFRVRKERWLRYPIGLPFIRLAHAAWRFVLRPKIPFRVSKALWLRYPIGMPFVRLSHAARRFIPRPKALFRVRKAHWIRNQIIPTIVHVAHTVHRFIPRPKVLFRVRKEHWLRNPSGFPFIRLAHAARHFTPKPKLRFAVHKARWLRYAIGMPFVHVARAGRRFVPRPWLPFRVHKARWIRYPVAAQFVRLAHAACRFTPRPKIPFKVRKERWLRYPIGLPFVSLAHAARHVIRDPKLPSWVRKARWIRYPIGLPFEHVARVGRRFVPRPKLRFAVRKERWIRIATGLPFMRLAHAIRHFVRAPLRQRIATSQRHRAPREFLLISLFAHLRRQKQPRIQPATVRIGKIAHKVRTVIAIPLGSILRRKSGRYKPFPWLRPWKWWRRRRELGIPIPIPSLEAPRIIFPATLDITVPFNATLDQTIIFEAQLDQSISLPARLP